MNVTVLAEMPKCTACRSGVCSSCAPSCVKHRLLESCQDHSPTASFRLRKLEIKMIRSTLCTVKDQSLSCSNKLL